MKPSIDFHQGVVNEKKGHCFAISAKWVGLMLAEKGKDAATSYLTRTTKRVAQEGARTWSGTKRRMENYLTLELGPIESQRVAALNWIQKYSGKPQATLTTVFDADDADDDNSSKSSSGEEGSQDYLSEVARQFATAAEKTRSSWMGLIVSAENPAHTIGIAYVDGDYWWFDPNLGVFNLGGLHDNWKDKISKVCQETQFTPAWALGVKL